MAGDVKVGRVIALADGREVCVKMRKGGYRNYGWTVMVACGVFW